MPTLTFEEIAKELISYTKTAHKSMNMMQLSTWLERYGQIDLLKDFYRAYKVHPYNTIAYVVSVIEMKEKLP